MAKISVEEARRLSAQVLTRAGISSREIEIITDVLVEAELLGRSTHGLIRLSGIVNGAKDHAGAEIRVVREKGYYALVDGAGGFGYTVAHYATELAIKKAQQNGLAMIGVKNSGHTGLMGYYVRMALTQDLIGMAICNTRPMVAAWGGTEAAFGAESGVIPSGRGPVDDSYCTG